MTAEDFGKSLDKYGEEDWLGTLVRYGLILGAVFQLGCIAAAVLMTDNESGESDTAEDNRISGESAVTTTTRRFHKPRKTEKKKRR